MTLSAEKRLPRVSIIIPTLNEEKGIKETIQKIPDHVKEYSETIVVDGLSNDGTASEAREANAKILIEKRKGKGIAMRSGAEFAKGEVLIFIDGDGTYPSDAIPRFVNLLEENDMVIGNIIPFIRALKRKRAEHLYVYLSTMLTSLLFSIFRIDLEDPLDGMRAIRKADFEKLNLESEEFEIEAEMNIKAWKRGFKIAELPIKYLKRKGRSKFAFALGNQLRIIRMLISNVIKDAIQ
jgi:glycosyltransferase involved in cell wall biosynthesis